jgi:hypothetical protein
LFPGPVLPGSTRSVAPRLFAAFAPRTRGAGVGSQPCNNSASARRDSPQDSTRRVGFGQCAMRVLGRATCSSRLRSRHVPGQALQQDLLYCSAQGLGRRASGVSAGQRRPNKSFKPNPLRYAKHMAGKACHVFRFTTLLGLTLVLGLALLLWRPRRVVGAAQFERSRGGALVSSGSERWRRRAGPDRLR